MHRSISGNALGVDVTAGPPTGIRWLAFIGWLVLPIVATWAVVQVSDLQVLWWGFVWTGFAVAYMIFYFRWAKRRYPPSSIS